LFLLSNLHSLHFLCVPFRLKDLKEEGKIIIITAPSGAGKTTLVRRLLTLCPELEFSISACTRKPRAGEIDGQDYYFYSEEKFRHLLEENAFVEWEMVYAGKYYGTLRSELQRIWLEHRVPLVDIDVQGSIAIKTHYPKSSLSVFIKPPSIDVLRERLIKRGTEGLESLEERISKATYELTFASQFDSVHINDDLEETTQELLKVVKDFLAK